MATHEALGERCPDCGSLDTSVREDPVLFTCRRCGFEKPYQDIVEPLAEG